MPRLRPAAPAQPPLQLPALCAFDHLACHTTSHIWLQLHPPPPAPCPGGDGAGAAPDAEEEDAGLVLPSFASLMAKREQLWANLKWAKGVLVQQDPPGNVWAVVSPRV